MRMRFHLFLASVALLGALAVTACQQRQEVGDEEGADTLTVEDTTLMPTPPPATGGDTTMSDTMTM